MELTFENFPSAFTDLANDVREIKQLLRSERDEQKSEILDKLFTVPEAAEFLNLAVPTIYSMVSRGELPVMKRSKRLYFSKLEMMAYLKEGRKKSNSEIQSEVDQYLLKKKGGKNA